MSGGNGHLANGGKRKNGQFAPGWPGGPGRPKGSSPATKFRTAVAEATSIEDVKAIWDELLKQAKDGKPWAIREVLDRVFGKSVQPLLVNEGENVEDARQTRRRELLARPKVAAAIAETELELRAQR